MQIQKIESCVSNGIASFLSQSSVNCNGHYSVEFVLMVIQLTVGSKFAIPEIIRIIYSDNSSMNHNGS